MQGEKEENNKPQKLNQNDIGEYAIEIPSEISDNRKRAMLTALISTMGIVTQACAMSKVPKSTYYDWCNSQHNSYDPEFAKAVENVTEYQKDFVESKILKKIKEEDTTVMIFYAKTKMKDRGYIERTEIAPITSPHTHVYYPEAQDIPHEEISQDAGNQDD